MGAVDLKRAERAQNRLADAVHDNPAVNGVGIIRAHDGYVLKVNIRSAKARDSIPTEFDGVPVRVHTVGRIRKRQVA